MTAINVVNDDTAPITVLTHVEWNDKACTTTSEEIPSQSDHEFRFEFEVSENADTMAWHVVDGGAPVVKISYNFSVKPTAAEQRNCK